ncbi:MAG: hypothetical protein LC687_03020 [Actinobacteria bacterium]|nr:hypothetical protein [Actinomycetota bacterium]
MTSTEKLENLSDEQLEQLLEKALEIKSAKAKAHRTEVRAEIQKRATYRLVDKPVLFTRGVKDKLASAKREREAARKARVAEMQRVEAEHKAEREAKAEARKTEVEAHKLAKEQAKKLEKANKLQIINLKNGEGDLPM